MWETYTKNDNNIKIRIQEGKTPVADVYDLIANPDEFQAGDTVVLGKSDKDEGDKRFDRAASYAERHNPGVAVEQVITPQFGGKGMGGTNMRNIIDQSNAKWRREINTVNTATQNETNRINTQLMYNIAGTALNDLWQQYRDNATFNFTASESELQRKHEQVIQALDAAANSDAYNKAAKTTLANNIIKVIGKW